MRWTIASLSFLAFGLGCGSISDSSEGFSHAVAMFTCGPADGPATAIVLAREPISSAQPAPPYVWVTIWLSVTELAGRSFAVDGEATGWYQTGPSSHELATAGTVHVDAVTDDLTVHGVVDLRFPSGRVVRGFSAEWRQSSVLCG